MADDVDRAFREMAAVTGTSIENLKAGFASLTAALADIPNAAPGLADAVAALDRIPPDGGCHCWDCNPGAMWMIVCPDCGFKRCPRANHHGNACTRSNEPGQPGSAYEHGSGAATARRFAAWRQS